MVGRGQNHLGLVALILAALASSSAAQTTTGVMTTTASVIPAQTPSPSVPPPQPLPASSSAIPGFGTVVFGVATIQASTAISLLASGTRSGVFIQEDGFPAGTQVAIRNFPYTTPSANMPATAAVASDALSFYFSRTAEKDLDVNVELLPLLQNSVRRQTIKCPDCEFKLHWLDKVTNEWNPICDSDYRNNPVGQPKSVQGTVPSSALNISIFNPSSGCFVPGCDGRGGLFAVFSTVECKNLAEFEQGATAGIILAVLLGSVVVLCCSTIAWYWCRRAREKKDVEDEDPEVEYKRPYVPSSQPSPPTVAQYPPIRQYFHQVPAYPPNVQPQQVQRGHAIDGFQPVPGFGDHPVGAGGSPWDQVMTNQLSHQVQRSYQLPGSSSVSGQQMRSGGSSVASQQFVPNVSPKAPPMASFAISPSWM